MAAAKVVREFQGGQDVISVTRVTIARLRAGKSKSAGRRQAGHGLPVESLGLPPGRRRVHHGLHEKGDKRRTVGLHFQAAQALAEISRRTSSRMVPLFRPAPEPAQQKAGGLSDGPRQLVSRG